MNHTRLPDRQHASRDEGTVPELQDYTDSEPVLPPVTATTTSSSSGRAPQLAKMPWYPRDFASSTRGWPLAARGAYRELLDAQWDMKDLSKSSKDLCAITGATAAEWRIAWPLIERKFPVGPNGRRMNERLEVHRRKSAEQFSKQSAGGVAGNESRWRCKR